jgi:hypothetical protein
METRITLAASKHAPSKSKIFICNVTVSPTFFFEKLVVVSTTRLQKAASGLRFVKCQLSNLVVSSRQGVMRVA